MPHPSVTAGKARADELLGTLRTEAVQRIFDTCEEFMDKVEEAPYRHLDRLILEHALKIAKLARGL